MNARRFVPAFDRLDGRLAPSGGTIAPPVPPPPEYIKDPYVVDDHAKFDYLIDLNLLMIKDPLPSPYDMIPTPESEDYATPPGPTVLVPLPQPISAPPGIIGD